MKKFLAMAVLVLSVFILQMPQVQADNEKYVGQYATGYDVYLLLDSYNFKSAMNLDFTCKVKATDGYDGRVTDDPALKVEATIFKFTAVMAAEYLKSRR